MNDRNYVTRTCHHHHVTELEDDVRFSVPLYSVAEVARYVDMPQETLRQWARGYSKVQRSGRKSTGAPIVTAFEAPVRGHRLPTMPFVGLAESMVLSAIRRSGVPLQRIRPALEQLQKQLGVRHALASQQLFTDGAEVLYNIAAESADPQSHVAMNLIVIRNGQHIFTDIVREYLHKITYDEVAGFASAVRLPLYEHSEVVVDPYRSFGRPIFANGGSRVSDVLERFWAGETLDELSEEFGVPQAELEDAVRVASQAAA